MKENEDGDVLISSDEEEEATEAAVPGARGMGRSAGVGFRVHVSTGLGYGWLADSVLSELEKVGSRGHRNRMGRGSSWAALQAVALPHTRQPAN